MYIAQHTLHYIFFKNFCSTYRTLVRDCKVLDDQEIIYGYRTVSVIQGAGSRGGS